MDGLIREYKKGRKALRDYSAALTLRIRELEDGDYQKEDLEAERSIVESMIRDMSDAIVMMSGNTYADTRGYTKKKITMDPHEMAKLEISAARQDPEAELELRNGIRDHFGELIRKRILTLTMKQRYTLERWIYEDMTLSEIAKADKVTRQAVWIRIFGDRTNRGAIKILRGEDENPHE